jgi:ATP-dependent Clp protease protease subunit
MPTNRKTVKGLGDCRIIKVFGDIEEELTHSIIEQLIKLDRKNGKDILLLIDSNGGDVDLLVSIYQTTLLLRCKVATLVLSNAASAAAILLACGHVGKRMVMEHSIVMLHDISSAMTQDYHKVLENELQNLRCSKKIIGNILTEHKAEAAVKLIKPEATYLLGAESIKYGLADVVIKKLEDIYRVANI